MKEFEKYFILVVVVWRFTHLISAEDGPFDLIFKLRKAAGNSFFGKLMDCFYCLSIWVGLAASFFISTDWQQVIIFCIYYSGASIIIEKLTNKNFI